MAGGERLRLFLALPLPPDVVERLVAWQREAFAGVRDVRVVPPGNLHVTLVFLGGRRADDVEPIVHELRSAAKEVEPPRLAVSHYRETRSVGMLVLDDHGGHATDLARRLSERLVRLGVYEPERRPWRAHLTVLRFRRPPRIRPDAPDPGEICPSDVALYTSVLRRTGAQYEIRESVPLGG